MSEDGGAPEQQDVQVAVIPARGGSKRIPRKNIRLFNGKPMIGYSIDAALGSGCFDRVVVSTDDEKIASIARDFGAEVPFSRPPELSDDRTGLAAVMRHAVCRIEEEGGPLAYACCIFATAPFLTPVALREGVERLKAAPDKQYAVSVTDFPFPIQRAVRIRSDHTIELIRPECMYTRSQDLEPAYHEAAQFFWGRPDALRHEIPIYAPGVSVPVLIPRHRVQDIDTPEDWIRAEWLYKALAYEDAEGHAGGISS